MDSKSSEYVLDQLSRESYYKPNVTKQNEFEMMIAKTSMAMELGNINHNLDVLNQDIQERLEKFNGNTILDLDIGNKLISSENEYRVVCKIGYGGFSVVWLVIDMKTHEFKVAKVFIVRKGISELEEEIHQQTSGQPNILRFYEHFYIRFGETDSCVGVYEPLGKDLSMLMKEASKYGCLSIAVIKKVAKHVLMALKAIHDLKVIHSDIKPNNIATCVSQLSLRLELEKIVEFMKSGKNISPLRMVWNKYLQIDGLKEKTKDLEEELEQVSKLELKDATELIFKLIDFGNVFNEGSEHRTGTPGFCPPEYFFGAPLLPSHDIWSLGVTIVVLLTNKTFLEYGNGGIIDYSDSGPSSGALITCTTRLATAIEAPNRTPGPYDIYEITSLRNMFGMFSRRHFKNFKNLDGYKTKFSTRYFSSLEAKNRMTKFLQFKFGKLQMDYIDRNELIDFLGQMLNTVPSERKSATELLLHPWLNDDVMARGDDSNEHKLYPDDDHDFSNKFSATLIPQRKQKEANANEDGTPLDSAVSSSPSKDTSETSWDDDLSINAQMELDNVVLSYCDNEDENYDSDKESDDPVDSDSDETDDDSNITISEFGSGESYFAEDATCAPTIERFSDDNFGELLRF